MHTAPDRVQFQDSGLSKEEVVYLCTNICQEETNTPRRLEELTAVSARLSRLQLTVEQICASNRDIQELLLKNLDEQNATATQLEKRLSASIAAQVLDKLPDKLSSLGLGSKSYTKLSDGPDRLLEKFPAPAYEAPAGISAQNGSLATTVRYPRINSARGDRGGIVSQRTAEDDHNGEVDANTGTLQKAARKSKMNMALPSIELPEIELEEDSSLLGIFTNDSDVCRPVHRVEDYYWSEGMFQAIARSNKFQDLTIVVVLANAVYLAVDSDWNNATNVYDAEWPFLVATQLFAVYFTLELLIRFLAFRRKKNCLLDGWFKFDLFLLLSMILDVWVIMLFLKLADGAGKIAIPTQPLRLLRLFKLTRMARLMKAFPELMTLIKGLIQSLRATASSLVLLMLLIYTEAILFHLIMKDSKKYNAHLREAYGYDFQSIGHCMWALLMAGTLMLDNAAPFYSDLVFEDKPIHVLAGYLFLFFTFVSALLILQMLIGVLCEVVARVTDERRNAVCVGLVKQELMAYLKTVNVHESGMISKHELEPMFHSANALALLKKLKINKGFFHEMSGLIFPDEDAQVPIRNILELLLMCRGENPVSVNILASSMCLVINHLEEVTMNVEEVADSMGIYFPRSSSQHSLKSSHPPSRNRGDHHETIV